MLGSGPGWDVTNVAELLRRPGVHNLAELLGGHGVLDLVVLQAAERWQAGPRYSIAPAIALLDGGPVRVSFANESTLVINTEQKMASSPGALASLSTSA